MDKHFGKMVRGLALTQMARIHGAGGWTPAIDVYEADRELLLCVELAGIDTDQLRVVADADKVTVSGVRYPAGQGFSRVHQLEIDYGAFTRTIKLLSPIDINTASATMKNGFLTVRLPKMQVQGKVKIELS